MGFDDLEQCGMEAWFRWNYPDPNVNDNLYALDEIVYDVAERHIASLRIFYTDRQERNAFAELVFAMRYYLEQLSDEMDDIIDPFYVSYASQSRYRSGKFIVEAI